MSKLTAKQQAALDAIKNARHWSTGPQLAARLEGSPSVEGVHQTCASLVRRGLILRRRELGEPTTYTIAPAAHTAAVVAARKRYDEAATRVDRILARDALQRVLAGVR